MTAKDEFGYPLDDVLSEGYIRPVTLPSTATATDHHRHADAYAEYQERFRRAYMQKVKSRSSQRRSD